MEAIFLAIATAASSFATSVGVGTAAALAIGSATASFLSFAVPIGLSIGLSLLLRPRMPKPSDGQVEIKQPVPPRWFHYGRVKISGPLAFYEARTDGVKQSLWKIVLLSSRQIDAIEEHYLNDELVTIGGVSGHPGWVNEDQYWLDGIARARIVPYFGTDDQLSDATLQTVFPIEWTADHRLRGIAYVMVQLRAAGPEHFNRVYPNGEATYSAVIRGNLVYDPRLDDTVEGGVGTHRHADKSTWAWSANPTLCTLDYLTHVDGYARPISKFYLPDFMAKADIDDEPVTLKAGGTEPRYRVAMTVYLTEARKDALSRLLEAGDAQLYPRNDGTVGIRGGAWVAPTVTFDESQILDARFSNGVDALSHYNELAFQYVSPQHDFTEVEGDPWQDVVDIVATGLIETRPIELMQVPSHGQARRLSKLRMRRDNPTWLGEIRTNFSGLDAIGERVVTVRWPELGIDLPFWIDSDVAITDDGAGMKMALRAADATAYDWDAVTEEGEPPEVPPDIEGEVSSEYDADADAWFNACSTMPSPPQKYIYNNLVLGLKADGLWDAAKWLLPLAGHAAPDIYRNMKSPAQVATPSGGLTIVVDRGVTGNGTTGFIDLGVAPNAIAGFAQDSAAMLTVVRTAGAATVNIVGSSAATSLLFNPKNGSGNIQSRLNDVMSAALANAGSRAGRWITSRTAGAGYDRYRDGTALAAVVEASTGVATTNVYVLQHAAAFANDELSFFGIFSGLTPTQAAALDARVASYLTAIGA